MKILQVDQGYYRNLAGLTLGDVLHGFAEFETRMVQAASDKGITRTGPNNFWRILEDLPESRRATWAKEWYLISDDGILARHSVYYDSSG